METRVVHNEDAGRYELYVADTLTSFADYRREGDALVFDHTETDVRYQGRGLAAKLVEGALEDVRKKGLHVVPACWFVADFIGSNPEYGDLVA